MEWRPVVRYEGRYEVSSCGDIRSVMRGRGAVFGRIRKLSDHAMGYKSVSLWKAGKGRTHLVHRLVAEAFLGPVPKYCEVNHKNGDKTDNRVENLEYVTRPHNIQHAMATGLMNIVGTDNPSAKLTENQVRQIKERHMPGKYGYKRLAAEFGVTWEAIRNIIKGRAWDYVEADHIDWQPPPPKKTAWRLAKDAEQARALELRRAGWTYDAIAQELGYRDRIASYKAAEAARQREPKNE